MFVPDYWFTATGKTQRRVVSQQDGSTVVSYVDNLLSLPMRLVPGGGGESGGQERLSSYNPNTIYVQNAPDIVATDRIVFDGRVYDITSVNNPDEQDVYLIINCYEVQPSGVGA